jgi:protein TonB
MIPQRDTSELLPSQRAAYPAREPARPSARAELSLPLTVLLSIVVHGLVVVAIGAAAAPREPREREVRPLFVEVAMLSAIAPEPPREQPKPAEPVVSPARPAKPRAPAPEKPVQAEPPVPAPESVAAPAPEPVPAPAAVAEPSATAPAATGTQAVGAVGASGGTGAAGGQGTGGAATPVRVSGPAGPSDAERLRAQRLYVRSLEDLIRAHTRYPRAAARAGLEGRVVLGLRVAPDGAMVGLRVATSSQHDLLDEAALEAARELGKLPAPPALAGIRSRDEVLVGVVYVVR